MLVKVQKCAILKLTITNGVMQLYKFRAMWKLNYAIVD